MTLHGGIYSCDSCLQCCDVFMNVILYTNKGGCSRASFEVSSYQLKHHLTPLTGVTTGFNEEI